jgi:hypothetical protein
MARAALERTLQALRYLRVERKGVVLLCQREVSMGSHNGCEQHRMHTQNLAAATALRQPTPSRLEHFHSFCNVGMESLNHA